MQLNVEHWQFLYIHANQNDHEGTYFYCCFFLEMTFEFEHMAKKKGEGNHNLEVPEMAGTTTFIEQ